MERTTEKKMNQTAFSFYCDILSLYDQASQALTKQLSGEQILPDPRCIYIESQDIHMKNFNKKVKGLYEVMIDHMDDRTFGEHVRKHLFNDNRIEYNKRVNPEAFALVEPYIYDMYDSTKSLIPLRTNFRLYLEAIYSKTQN